VCVCVWLLCRQDDIYLQFYIPICSPPTGTPNIHVRIQSDLYFIITRRNEFHIVHLNATAADTGCVGVGESVVFNIESVCVCGWVGVWRVCFCFCWFRRRRRQSDRVTDERRWPKPTTHGRRNLLERVRKILCVVNNKILFYILTLADPSRCCPWRIKFPCQ